MTTDTPAEPVKLTTKEYWDSGHSSDFTPFRVQRTVLSKEFKRLLKPGSAGTCVEVGAYPGQFLCEIAGTYGYKAVALDYTEDVDDIRSMLEHNGLQDYEVIQTDFLAFSGRQFDLTTSFGFVEHFSNYQEIIKKHFDITKDGGMVLVSVPYLGGLQGLLRRLVYTDEALRSVWSSHNTQLMQLQTLRGEIAKHAKELLFADYCLRCRVWLTPQDERIRPGMRWLVRVARFLDKSIGRLLPSSRLWSPMILVAARK